MIQLSLIVPPDRSDRVVRMLLSDERVSSLVVQAGAALRPAGDAITCDVTREAVSDVLSSLRELGLYEDGSVTVSTLDAAPSHNAQAAERAAPGAPDDAVIWDQVLDQAYAQTDRSWSFYAFLTLATMIAAVAVITDSSILVVGAMVVGPEFAAVAALALGLDLARGRLAIRSVRLLVSSFALAIALTIAAALLAKAVGWIDVGAVTADRPLTGFIWRPDRWSVVVAVLAGCAGVLSQTAGRTNALVGVFISVTTVPAAGDLALSIAVWAPDQIGGSAAQLGINLVGMTLAGVVTLRIQRSLWRVVTAKRGRSPRFGLRVPDH